MQLNNRLKWLEQRVAPPTGDHCRACGLPLPGVPWKGRVQVGVGWWSPGDPEVPPCRACGQKAVIRIEFDRAG